MMSTTRQAVHAASMISLALLLTSCAGDGEGVTLPPGAEDLELCPVSEIEVTDLAAAGAPGCDLDGSTLRFPDGQRERIHTPGVVESTGFGPGGDKIYMVVNWGVPGVGASITDPENNVIGIWGSSPEAIELHEQQIALSDPVPAG